MVRSNVAVLGGASLFSASMFAMLFLLLFVKPYGFESCLATLGGGGFCSNSESYLFLFLFVPYVEGIGLFFYGVFGRNFVISPLFVLGMIPLTWGTAGVIFGILSQEVCSFALCSLSGYQVNFGPSWTAATGGVLVISLQTLIQNRMTRFKV